MPTLKFDDSQGVSWRVWSTIPGEDSPLAKYYPGGWLTFDAGGSTLRRLSPVPKGWESCSPERLELMCRVAAEVPRHTGEVMKMERPTTGPLADSAPVPEPRPTANPDAAKPLELD